MKKFITVILVSLLFVLSGCSSKADGKADISNKDDAVLTINSQNFTRDNFYRSLMSTSGPAVVMQKLVSMVYAAEINEDDSSLIADAQKQADDLVANAGDMLDFYLYYAGVSTIEQYKEVMVYYNKIDAIVSKYVGEHMEELITAQAPKKFRMIACTSMENAEAALNALSEGTVWDEVVTLYNNSTNSTAERIVNKDTTSLDAALKSALEAITTNGLHKEVIADSNNANFYVVEMLDVDAHNFQDELSDSFLTDGIVTENDVLPAYAKKGNFQIYDEELYNAFKEQYPAYFE